MRLGQITYANSKDQTDRVDMIMRQACVLNLNIFAQFNSNCKPLLNSVGRYQTFTYWGEKETYIKSIKNTSVGFIGSENILVEK